MLYLIVLIIHFLFDLLYVYFFFFFQAEDGIRDIGVTGVQTCALPILTPPVAVPLFASSLEPHHDALAERIAAVVASGRYILGPEVSAFEAEFASHLGVEHCVGVANGTDALAIALRALGVGPGDEVVCPSLTFYATAEAIADVGARPVFCDVDPDTACVTRTTVEAATSERTKAIVPVHLFGNI